MSNKKHSGFTLIEVLIALLILAIALMALLQSSATSINNTQRLNDKIISQWVMQQGITMIQLGIIKFPVNQDLSQVTQIFGQKWYWRAHRSKTPITNMLQITVTASRTPTGPWRHKLIAYGSQ
jgi:general secretion pathway protein I